MFKEKKKKVISELRMWGRNADVSPHANERSLLLVGLCVRSHLRVFVRVCVVPLLSRSLPAPLPLSLSRSPSLSFCKGRIERSYFYISLVAQCSPHHPDNFIRSSPSLLITITTNLP